MAAAPKCPKCGQVMGYVVSEHAFVCDNIFGQTYGGLRFCGGRMTGAAWHTIQVKEEQEQQTKLKALKVLEDQEKQRQLDIAQQKQKVSRPREIPEVVAPGARRIVFDDE